MKALSAAAGFEGRRLNGDERLSLDTALRYFREAPRHNGDEEESRFPRLRLLPDLEIGRALADLARLEQEHHWAAPLHTECSCRDGMISDETCPAAEDDKLLPRNYSEIQPWSSIAVVIRISGADHPRALLLWLASRIVM